VGPQLGLLRHYLVPSKSQKEKGMSKHVLIAKLTLAVLVLASLAVLAGDLPWGPN
jgi:hypothetical protein